MKGNHPKNYSLTLKELTSEALSLEFQYFYEKQLEDKSTDRSCGHSGSYIWSIVSFIFFSGKLDFIRPLEILIKPILKKKKGHLGVVTGEPINRFFKFV